MAVGDLVTGDYQYEYNGLLFGAGTVFDITKITGLLGYPTLRSDSKDRFGRHGGTAARHYGKMKKPNISGRLLGKTDDLFGEARTQLMSAFAIRTEPKDVLPLVYKHPGTPKGLIYCRPIDLDMPIDRQFALKYPRWAVRFEATDPLIYSSTEKSIGLTALTTSGGLIFPLTFPLVFGAGFSTIATIDNEGNAPAPWRAVLAGPATNPSLRNETTGQVLTLVGVSLQAGETLVYDSATSSIKLNGVSDRTVLLDGASSWWDFDEGTTDLRYTAAGAATSNFTIYWRDAYWGL